MRMKHGFTVPYMISGMPTDGNLEGPCQEGFHCQKCFEGCVDGGQGCGWGFGIASIGVVAAIVIAIVPTNAAPG